MCLRWNILFLYSQSVQVLAAKEYTIFSPVMLIISCTCPYVYHLPISPWFPGGRCSKLVVCWLVIVRGEFRVEFKQKNPKNKSVATHEHFSIWFNMQTTRELVMLC